MARDTGGTYTRINNSFSNPVAGTAIDPNDADSFFDEIGTEMTDSLCRSGKGSMLANLSMGGFAITTATSVQFKGSSSGFTLLAPSAAASGTLTLPAATDTIVGKATTDILSNKTIDTAAPNTIKINGNTLSATSGTATITIPNSTDTLVGKTTTDVLTNKTLTTPTINQPTINGVTSNTAAGAGVIGEFVSSSIAAGSAVSLVNATAKDVTTISLTAGNWLVWGNVTFAPGASTTQATLIAYVNTTANTLPSLPNGGAYSQLTAAITTGSNQTLTAGTRVLSLSGTTTVSLGAYSAFAVSTQSAYGFIGAVRFF